MTLTLALSACATAANRRALYNPKRQTGPWTDYEKRRLAEEQTGVTLATTTTMTTTSPATPPPRSKPVMEPGPTKIMPAIAKPTSTDAAPVPEAAMPATPIDAAPAPVTQ